MTEEEHMDNRPGGRLEQEILKGIFNSVYAAEALEKAKYLEAQHNKDVERYSKVNFLIGFKETFVIFPPCSHKNK